MLKEVKSFNTFIYEIFNTPLHSRKEVPIMSNLSSGREKILKFLDEHKMSVADLASAYSVNRSELSNYLNGNIESEKGNKLILKIISDFKIR